MIYFAVISIFPVGLALAAISDLLTMKIPNRISAALIGMFFLIAPFAGLDFNTIFLSVAAGMIVLICGFILFATHTMGGGDVKLLTASALWFGFNSSLFTFMLTVAFVGGALTLSILILRSRSQEILAYGLPIPDSLLVAKKIPYGIAIAIAGLMTYPEAPIVQAAMRSIL